MHQQLLHDVEPTRWQGVVLSGRKNVRSEVTHTRGEE
jgi:hypothetical protein